MADVLMTQEQVREADDLINRTLEPLGKMRASFDDPERFLAARYEWKEKRSGLMRSCLW